MVGISHSEFASMLANTSHGELLNAIHNPTIMEINKYPSHKQTVDRCVKLVTEDSMAVCGEKSSLFYSFKNRFKATKALF